MVLPILTFGESALHRIAEPADISNPNLPTLIENMIETMENAEGIGLSAPQVGESIRLIVYKTNNKNSAVMINPLIVGISIENQTFCEGCLSIPGITKYVTRPKKIKVKYFDEKFTLNENYFTGMDSIVIQHEIDHLNGKLLSDSIERSLHHPAKSKLLKIRRGKFKTSYPIKRTKK